MFYIQTMNKISPYGLELFDRNKYRCGDEQENPDALLVRSASLHEMEFHDSLRAIARAGAGVNNIPVDRCSEQGIVVFNTPGANANAVKELVICGLLLSARKVFPAMEWVQTLKGQGDQVSKLVEQGKSKFSGPELLGKRLGVIGLGAIGVRVANAAVHLGMEVYGYDHFISVDAAWSLSRSIHHINDVNMIYRDCDYITIHVPLMDSTRGMIGRDEIAQMKEGVVLLNFARDLLVDEEALAEALREGKVKKYVTDFANPLVASTPNTLVTPHLGASTEESEDNCAVMAVHEIMDYLENGNIKNSVNYPNCDAGACVDVGRVTINHKNIPNMISQFTKTLGDAGVNISNMTNKSKGDYAYTMIDVSSPISKEVADTLKNIKGVYRVRIVK